MQTARRSCALTGTARRPSDQKAGSCQPDLRSYQYWLHRDSGSRAFDLHGWINLPYPVSEFIPTINANKHVLNIRFAILGGDARPHTSNSNVEFELTLCNL